jgi:antitoxin ParD1/3/4
MAKNTSILLTPYYEKLIAKGVKSGEYSSASEVVREALRIWAKQDKKRTELDDALEAGEKSGYIENFSFDTFIEEMKSKS